MCLSTFFSYHILNDMQYKRLKKKGLHYFLLVCLAHTTSSFWPTSQVLLGRLPLRIANKYYFNKPLLAPKYSFNKPLLTQSWYSLQKSLLAQPRYSFHKSLFAQSKYSSHKPHLAQPKYSSHKPLLA